MFFSNFHRNLDNYFDDFGMGMFPRSRPFRYHPFFEEPQELSPFERQTQRRRYNPFDEFFEDPFFNPQHSLQDQSQKSEEKLKHETRSTIKKKENPEEICKSCGHVKQQETRKQQHKIQEIKEKQQEPIKRYYTQTQKINQFTDENGQLITDIQIETDQNGTKNREKQKLVYDKNKKLISRQKWTNDEIDKLETDKTLPKKLKAEKEKEKKEEKVQQS